MPIEAKKSLLYLFAILPSVFSLFSIIPMFFYKLSGKEHKKITKELEEKRQQSLDEINILHGEAAAVPAENEETKTAG